MRKQPGVELECFACVDEESKKVMEVGCVDEQTGELWSLCKRCELMANSLGLTLDELSKMKKKS